MPRTAALPPMRQPSRWRRPLLSRLALSGGLALSLAAGLPSAFAAPASAIPPGDEPGVTMRVFSTPYNLQAICTIKPGQTPNVDKLMESINWTSAEQFGMEDNFVAHALANLTIETAGSYEFQLTSDDGSRLLIDDQLIIDHDGLHGAEPKTGTVDLSAGVHALRTEFFEAGGGQELTLRWKKPGDAEFSLVGNDVLSTEAGVTRVTAPGAKECEGITDSPGDGLQLDSLNPAYDLVDLRPEGFEPQVTGLAWEGTDLLTLTWGGTGDPDNQTSEGELYRLAGVQTATSPADVTPVKIADKLHEPMGVAVVDVDQDGTDEIYVSEKHGLTKLTDSDGDGFFEGRSELASWDYAGNFHEFAFGLLHRDGKFHLNLSVAIDYGGNTTNPQPATKRGTYLTVDDTTGEVTYVAGGLRTPNGIGFGPEGEIFTTDNQGGWLPANKLIHVQPGHFYNHYTTDANGNPGPFDDQEPSPPALWLPQNEIANSPSTPVLIPDGPFAGQMWISDVTYGGIQRAFLEKVDGEYQGAVFRMTQGLEAGVNRLLLGPDGSIYAGGLGAGGNWGQTGKLRFGLQKLELNGTSTFEMKSMEQVDGGFKVTYTKPLSAETLNDLAGKYTLKQWGYRPTSQYGGPKIDEETLNVASATPSEDGTSVTLKVDGLKPERVVYLRSPRPFAAASGESLWSTEAWYTMNNLPGYVPPPAPGGLYESEDQQLLGSANPQTEHAGFSGSGYVGGITSTGAGVTTKVTVDAAGEYDLALRYANGPNPFQGPKTMSMVLNGEEQQITLPSTGTWPTYALWRSKVSLQQGENTITLRYDADDDGNVNLDFLKVAPVDGTRYEAEAGNLTGSASVATEHAGYTGDGFVAGIESEGAGTTLTVHAPETADHPATLRFANGPNPNGDETKTMTLDVGGQTQQISLPATGSWTNWSTAEVLLPLQMGENKVSIRMDAGDIGHVNLDHLDVRMPAPLNCDAQIDPNDGFDGESLDRCRWRVLNEVRAGYSIGDSALKIAARPGDLSGGSSSADNLIVQPAPTDGTWTAESTVHLAGTDDYIQGGVVVYGNADNYGKVMLMRHPQNGWVIELAKVSGGQLAYSDSEPLPEGANVDGVRLRASADGERLRGEYSLDGGATWTEVGNGYGITGLTTPLIGLSAYNGTGSETASFDDFVVGEPVVGPDTCTPATPDEGYTMLYDGTRASMQNWEMADGGSFLRQPDCSIVSDGAFGLFWHTTPINYDYSLKLDWMMPGDDNSGVFVGFPDPQGDSWNPVEQGHEIQIDATDDADSTTGAIYNFQAANLEERDRVLNPPGEWNSYEIVVEHDPTADVQRIRIYLNGALINDYQDTDPNRMNLPSHIGLQTHGAGDEVFFRNVQIKDLTEPVVVDPVDGTITAKAVPGSLRPGQAGTVEVTVSADGVRPTGEVVITEGAKQIGRGTLIDGKVAVAISPFTKSGKHRLTVRYAGDAAVNPVSTTLTIQVKGKPTKGAQSAPSDGLLRPNVAPE